MTNAYIPQFKAECPCGWSMGAYEESRAATAARVHGELQPGHTAVVSPIAH